MKRKHVVEVCMMMCAILLCAVNASADDHAASTSASSTSSSTAGKATRRSVKPTTAKAATPAGQTSTDRLNLDTTTVSGNRELPRVQYIVPWKKADVGNLPGQPFNTLLDEALTPVDRDVFRREVEYYQAVSNKDQPGKGFAGARNSAQSAAPPATK